MRIIDITKTNKHEIYLYKCLAPIPSRKYKKRSDYLEEAIKKGFRKKIVALRGNVVGQIEYAPVAASGLPIKGNGFFVMNCIWVLRKAKGHDLGRVLINHVIKDIKNKNPKGLVTLGIKGHPSPWLKEDQMKRLGFKVIDSIRIRHRVKKWNPFVVYLMWLPLKKNVKKPILDKPGLLEGVDFCMAHPLYNPAALKKKQIFKRI